MSEANKGTLVALRDARERTIATLSHHFAHDVIDVDEFERRLTVAHAADTVQALEDLCRDLPAVPTPSSSPTAPAPSATTQALVPLGDVRQKDAAVAVMGSVARRGRWRVARKVNVVCVMGSGELDFREALFGPGVTELRIVSVMGSAEVIVPPGLAVEAQGTAVMGDFEHCARFPVVRDPEAPYLLITGVTVMGSVEIETRLPGESAGDAHRRRKKERKMMRERGHLALPPGHRE
ncbi:MAG: DUF1707 domain-containing protein [Myxococcota bacterium]